MEDTQKYIDLATEWGIKILLALAVFIIGKWIARAVTNGIKGAMTKKDVDPALISFLGSLIYYGLVVMVVISAVGQLGVKTTSFVAVVGAAGLAVGLALQGSLSNFASGTLIILFRPFKIGDVVEAGGVLGVIQEIGVLATVMKSPDNKKIILPNSAIMGGTITNITANPERRIDLTFGVGYDDDVEKAKEILLNVLKSNERVLQDPAPSVELFELADSSVNFVVRPWVKTSDWWPVRCELMVEMKKEIEAAGLSIPYPQQDVHMHQVK